jgi:prophage DNA circulation protein
LVIAHRVYQDASRVDELVLRNGIRHPGFVPAVALEVLQ